MYYYHLTTHSHCLLVVLSSTFSTSWACSAWTLSRRKSVLISLTTREQPTTYRDPPRRRLRSSRSRQASASLRSRKTTRKAMKKMLLKSIEGNLGPVLFSTSCLSFAVTSVSFLYSFVIIVISDHNFSQREGCILHLLVILTTQCHHGITGENISFTNILRHKRTVLRMC